MDEEPITILVPSRFFDFVPLEMDINESTNSILRETEFARENLESVLPETSTEALLDEGYIGLSTGSLVSKDVKDLLNQVFIQAPSRIEERMSGQFKVYEASASNNDTGAAPELNDRPLGLVSKRTIKEEGELEQNPSHDNPLLLMVYNKIQVFLLRNGMSLEFLRIFKKYVNNLMESGLDPLEDQYLLSLQNELSESFDFTPAMEDILNKFLLRPENFIMKLTLFEHQSAHNLQRRYVRTWKLHNEFKRSLQKLGGLWHEYLKRKFLIKWAQKYENCSLHWENQAQEFKKFSLLSLGFDNWLDKIDSAEARNGLADHYFLNNIFQKIKDQTNKLNLAVKKAESFRDTRSLKRAARTWRLKYRGAQFHGVEQCLKKQMFAAMRQRLKNYKAFEERADLLRYAMQVSSLINKWNAKAKYLDAQSSHLIYVEQAFIKRKTLGILKLQLKRRQQEYSAVRHLNALLLAFSFKELWLKRFQKQLHLYSFWKLQNEKILQNFFSQWKMLFFTGLRADEFARTRTLGRHLRKWRSRLTCNSFVTDRERASLTIILSNWSALTAQKRCMSQFCTEFGLKPFFSLWNNRRHENARLKNLALSCHDQILKIHFVSRWHQKLQFWRAMDQRAKILQKLRALTMLRRGISHYTEVKKMGDSFAKLFVSKKFLFKYLKIWEQKHVLHTQKKLQEFSESYQQGKDSILKRNFLGLWGQKTQFYLHDCQVKAEKVHQRALQRAVFKAFEQKMNHHAAITVVSSDFRKDSLLLAVFHTWAASLTEVREMDSRVQIEVNRKNLTLLLNYMKNWSMRILKSKRNYEAVQVFRNRWDRATVRGLLLVWKTRMDQSPGRYRDHMLQNIELKTPTRKISSKTSNTIPGSEGVKRHRIEAMKSHYSRVRRAIPSPIKSSLSLNSTAKKKIETEDNFFLSTGRQQRLPPPPRLSLEKINRNLASKIDRINFERIPEVRLEPFINSDSQSNPMIDRSLLKVDEEDAQFDESPTRRS